MDAEFDSWNISQLQDYLKTRGVFYSKLKKVDLVELCKLASLNRLEVDPNCFIDSIADEISAKLNVSGKIIPHPEKLSGSPDMSKLPNIDNFDIYNYLIQFKELYGHKQLKAFTNLVGYELYNAGYVESLEFVYDVGVQNIIVVKFRVKPKQRKEDPINKTPYYNGWVILDSNQPEILNAFCACKGGADGGCRHTVAVLFEIAECVNGGNRHSVTSALCQWKKKGRRDTDNPQPIDKLVTVLPGSSRNEPPTAECYDPYPGYVPDVDAFYAGLKDVKPNACMLLNRFKKENSAPPVNEDIVPTLLDSFIAILENNPSINSIEEVLAKFSYTEKDISDIEKCTRGQSDSNMWQQYRKGMITASNFFRISRLKDTTDPKNIIKLLIEGTSFDIVPQPLKWGKKKENVARKLFIRSHKAKHSKFSFEDQGLTVSKHFFIYGC